MVTTAQKEKSDSSVEKASPTCHSHIFILTGGTWHLYENDLVKTSFGLIQSTSAFMPLRKGSATLTCIYAIWCQWYGIRASWTISVKEHLSSISYLQLEFT